MAITEQSSPLYGKALLSFTFGSIPTRLFGEILRRRYAPMSISKFFGARFPSQRMRPRFRPGCRIFISIRKSFGSLIPILTGVDTRTFLPARSPAGEMQSRFGDGAKWNPGE